MKKLIICALLTSALCACEKQTVSEDLQEDRAARITFNLSRVETRATSLSDSEMTDLWLFDYIGDNYVQTIHLTSSDDDFVSVTATLSVGTHNIYFVASRGDDSMVDEINRTIFWGTPRDTFWGKTIISVTAGMTETRNVTLERVSSRLRITISDEIPSDMSRLSVKPDIWYFGMNYITSAAEFPEQRERSVTVPESYIGTTNKLTATFYGFSGEDEWNSDIPIKAYNNNSEIIGQATIRNATFIRNVSTEYSGCLFAGNPDFGIEINDDWEFPHTGTW